MIAFIKKEEMVLVLGFINSAVTAKLLENKPCKQATIRDLATWVSLAVERKMVVTANAGAGGAWPGKTRK